MRLCGNDCKPCCVYCRFFYSDSIAENNIYDDDGYCFLHDYNIDPLVYCDDFCCFTIEDENNQFKRDDNNG